MQNLVWVLLWKFYHLEVAEALSPPLFDKKKVKKNLGSHFRQLQKILWEWIIKVITFIFFFAFFDYYSAGMTGYWPTRNWRAVFPVGPRILGIGYWVLEKNLYSGCFWLTGKITVNCLIHNTQYPTLILFCLTGHWKNYGVSNIQYPTLNTQYPTLSTFFPKWHWKITVLKHDWFWPKKKMQIMQ